jgi:hypothetical protein
MSLPLGQLIALADRCSTFGFLEELDAAGWDLYLHQQALT